LGNAYTGLRVESAFNVVNSGNLISGNVSNGVWLVGNTAANNLLQGNWIGVALGGSSGLSNGLAGIGITEAPNNTIGGSAAGQGNLISANGDAGIFLLGTGVTGTIIQGNTIGADITGNSSLANRFEGIYSEKASNGTIGGSGPGAGNQIAGNTTREVWLTNSSYNVVQGNLIGVKADGVSNLGQKFFGVEMEVGANGNTIGGSAGAGNRIAYSQTVYAGVRVRDEATNNAILGNAIWGNGPTGGLGIDLGNYGVNANVNCGALTLTAANMYQNYPVLSQAFGGGPTTQVRGSLNSHPNTTYLLQFFGNPTCDPSGYGQGQIYLGDKMLALGASCSSNFVATVAGVPASYVVTATATDPAGNTSEFSACQVITPIPILNITNSGNHQVSIAWTNTATGFSLYCATNLGTSPILPPSIWSLVTNVPVVLNGNYIVSFPTTNYGDKFFTLIHP
jgi:hypothetical protein